MQTNLVQQFANTPEGQEAESILRACVHCGFCTATCPTYQELNDERDGPRGRIYLMKMFLEGEEVTEKSREHLDRCLTCRSCETTCPSGVKYGRLVDISRGLMEQEMPRPPKERWIRWSLARVLPNRRLFGFLLRMGQLFRPVLPSVLRTKVPPRKKASPWPAASHDRMCWPLPVVFSPPPRRTPTPLPPGCSTNWASPWWKLRKPDAVAR